MIFDCFLGASSPTGFAGFFDSLCDPGAPFRTCIIKGGPGCGKSSLMKRIGARAVAAGCDIERIHCSSDPDSLDGLICIQKGFALVDGTSPHVLEPAIPAAKQEVLSLYDCIDADALRAQLPALRTLFRGNARCHERARRFIVAAGALTADLERTAAGFLLRDKAIRYAENLSARLFVKKPGCVGSETLRLISAVTPQGLVDYGPQDLEAFRTRYVLRDRFGAAAHCILSTLRDAALAAGLDVISCRSPLAPYEKTDALFIPSLSLAFYWPAFGGAAPGGSRTVHDTRFYDGQALEQGANRLKFCKKAALSLLREACAILLEAKNIHDEIEVFYKNNIDFEAVHLREKAFCHRYGL
ncbi:MAG: hypothetical protein VB092_03430 [Oscillospiraceae bacterium]|nr:hypothetical protein [Oscillospiraceae bacterium]